MKYCPACNLKVEGMKQNLRIMHQERAKIAKQSIEGLPVSRSLPLSRHVCQPLEPQLQHANRQQTIIPFTISSAFLELHTGNVTIAGVPKCSGSLYCTDIASFRRIALVQGYKSRETPLSASDEFHDTAELGHL